MPRAAVNLGSFNAGELSPNIEGRVDIGKYANGCKTLENFIPLVQGPAKRRAGTRFVSEVKDSSTRTWLVRFEYNTQQAYILEFGHLYIRFYTNHGQVVSGPSTPYEIASPYTAADLTNADGTFGLRLTESNDVIYICHQNYQPRKLSRITASPPNWTISTLTPQNGPFKLVNTTATTVYASGQTGSVTLTASSGIFTSAMVGSLFYVQQKNILAIPMWEAGKTISAGARRRSNGINYLALSSATTGGVKPIHTSGAVFDGDSGVQWQYEDPGYGYGVITAVTNSTTATLNVVNSIPFYAVGSGQASDRWAFGAWSDVDGWPSQVNFYKERLVFGRGQNVWLSVVGDYENFASKDASGNVTDSQAISIILQSDKVNNMVWMASGDSLLVGTAGSEFAIQPITQNLPFGPTNCTAPSVSAFGSRNTIPAKISEATVFVQRSGIKVRDVIYDFVSNKFQSTDQNSMADHITQGGVNQMVYKQEPYSVIWCVRSDGALVAMTYSREQYDSPPYGGWHRHPIGGSFSGGPAVVESIATIPAPAGDRDELWAIVKRTINGVTKRYVEYFEYDRRLNDDPQDAFYVDGGATLDNTALNVTGSTACTLTPGAGALVAGSTGVVFTAGAAIFTAGMVGREIQYRYWTLDSDGKTKIYKSARATITGYSSATSVTATILQPWPSTAVLAASDWRLSFTTVTGLTWLEGQTVNILGDGATLPQQVVTGGAVTLPTPCCKVQIGLPFRSRLQTMRLNAGAGDGTSQGKTARINKASIRFLDTLGVQFGPSFSKLDDIDWRTVSDQMDGPPGLFTGDQLVDFDADYGTDPWVCIQTTEPQPATVIAVMPIISTYDRS